MKKKIIGWIWKQLLGAVAKAFVKAGLCKFLSSRPRVRKSIISLLLLMVQGLLRLVVIVQNIIARLDNLR